jgi:hypothetical protein
MPAATGSIATIEVEVHPTSKIYCFLINSGLLLDRIEPGCGKPSYFMLSRTVWNLGPIAVYSQYGTSIAVSS